MIDQLGPVLIFLGIMFLISGLIYFFMFRRQRNKHPAETLATITSCRKYTLKENGDTYIYQALILDFTVDNNNYKVRRDIGRESMPYLKASDFYSVGQQVKIHYNPKKPEDMYLVINNNSYKITALMSRVFIYAGLVSLLVGCYLTFYSI